MRANAHKIPPAYLGWAEGKLRRALFRFILFGEGDIALVTRERLHQTEPNLDRQLVIHVGEADGQAQVHPWHEECMHTSHCVTSCAFRITIIRVFCRNGTIHTGRHPSVLCTTTARDKENVDGVQAQR